MSKLTITESFEQPLRWVKQTAGSEKYAVITLHLEPLPTEAVEFGVALPHEVLPEHVEPGFLLAVEEGVRGYAKRHEIVGIRATLISIEAHPIDSSHVSFGIAGHQAMLRAIEMHGVPVSG
jgi:translation elongation factor EF-G